MVSTDRTHPGRGIRAEAGNDESRRAIRVLSRNGNSTTISVPVPFLHSMNLLPGSRVELVYDHEWGGFFVLPYVEKPIASTPPAPTGEATHGA